MAASKHTKADTFHRTDGEAAVSVYLRSIDALRDAKPLVPPAVEVPRYRILFDTQTGRYDLSPRHALVVTPDAKSRRPGKFARLGLKGGALLDSFFEGGEAFERANDAQVWEGALAFAREGSLRGETLTLLSEAVSLALAIRAGATHLAVWEASP